MAQDPILPSPRHAPTPFLSSHSSQVCVRAVRQRLRELSKEPDVAQHNTRSSWPLGLVLVSPIRNIFPPALLVPLLLPGLWTSFGLLTVCSSCLGGPCLEADSCQGPRVGAAEGIQGTLCSRGIPSAASHSHLLGLPAALRCLNVA